MKAVGQYLQDVRASAPLVHNITNFVAMDIMANTLLALGASPAMVHARNEVREFAGLAQALTVNVGTVDAEWAGAMEDAAEAMHGNGRPWVLDPVGVGATRFRTDLCGRLLAFKPTVVRGNASEILVLAGDSVRAGGMDSRDLVSDAEAAAVALAKQTGGVVIATGEVDYATDGVRAYRVANGHPWMRRVTAMGCALTGVIAAFLVEQQAALEASVAALACYGVAGEDAARQSVGPGTFRVAFIDALYGMTASDLDSNARITPA